MLSRHFEWLRALPLRPKATQRPFPNTLLVCNISLNSDVHENWSDLGSVLKELRNISREHQLEGKMPDTKLLKDLGYQSLVLAIRKRHGGVVKVASKLGTHKDREVVAVHKRVSARAKRRQKRHERLNMHDFY